MLSNKILNKYQVLNIKYFLYSRSIKLKRSSPHTKTGPFFTTSLLAIILKTLVREVVLVGMLIRNNFCNDRPPIRVSRGQFASGKAKFLRVSSLIVLILLKLVRSNKRQFSHNLSWCYTRSGQKASIHCPQTQYSDNIKTCLAFDMK